MRSFGAGSQLDSLSTPGLSFWMLRVSEPSAFFFMFGSIGELMRYRFIGFLMRSWLLPSYMVTDQKAFTGGSCPAGKVNMVSAGNGTGSHVSGELFNMMAGVDLLHVPYRGGAPALTDLIGGRV